MKLHLESGGRTFLMEVVRENGDLVVREGKRTWRVALDATAPGCRRARIDGRPVDFAWANGVISLDGLEIPVEVRDARTVLLEKAAKSGPQASGPVTVRAPIPGLVTKLCVTQGAKVKRGEPVLLLDAMKLENEIAAPRDGTVRSIDVTKGQAVERNAPLFVIV